MLGATQSPDPIAREMAAFNRATGLSASMDLTPPSVTGPVQPTVYSLPNDKPIISLDDEPDETEDEWWKDLGAAGQMDDEPDALRWPNAPELLTDLDDGEGKVSKDDTTGGFLEDKLVGGDGITISTTGGGGDEKINISLTSPNSVVPSGGIILWSGAISAIPTGWVLCDGSASTPDLRDKFVLGAASDAAATPLVGETGGNHLHGGGTTNNHTTHPAHGFDVNGTEPEATPQSGLPTAQTPFEHDAHSETDNRPAYYALAYIMKT